MADLLGIAFRNKQFVEDVMDNPEISNSATAIIDRFILICGKDIKDLKLDGPNDCGSDSGFDVSWKMGVKS